MARPRPLDEQFEDTYSQRASIKPSSGGISRTRKVKVDKRNPHQRRDNQGRVVEGRRKSANASNQVVVTTPKKAKVANPDDNGEQMAERESVVMKTRPPVKRIPRNFVGNQYTKAKVRARSKTAKGKTDWAARRKASVVNSATMSWLVPSYFFIQLPFAVLNLIFLGMYFVVATLTEGSGADDVVDEETGVISKVAGFFWKGVQFVAGALNEAVEALTGFDFLEFLGSIPQMGYMLTLSVLLGYAMFVLLTMSMMYMMAALKPLSGKGSGSKKVAFMMCFAGYFLPLFNLFPWAVVWAATVWKNPK